MKEYFTGSKAMKDKQNKKGTETDRKHLNGSFEPKHFIFTLNINGLNSSLRVSFRVHKDLRS